MLEFPALLPSAVQTLTADFGDLMAVGETVSTQSVAATVYSGTDSSPSSIITGSASASGTVVSQKIAAPSSAGNVYTLTWTITTSLSQTLKKSGLLAIAVAGESV